MTQEKITPPCPGGEDAPRERARLKAISRPNPAVNVRQRQWTHSVATLSALSTCGRQPWVIIGVFPIPYEIQPSLF